MSKKITVYTTTTCAYCVMVKKWLDSKGLSYESVNLDHELPEVRQKVIEMSGAMTVPVTVVEDTDDKDGMKNITVGWNPAKLSAAVADLVGA